MILFAGAEIAISAFSGVLQSGASSSFCSSGATLVSLFFCFPFLFLQLLEVCLLSEFLFLFLLFDADLLILLILFLFGIALGSAVFLFFSLVLILLDFSLLVAAFSCLFDESFITSSSSTELSSTFLARFLLFLMF